MELSDKVIIFYKDGHAAGTRLSNVLRHSPSSWKKIEMPLEIPLEIYGITDIVISGQIINFVDSQDYPQVSLIILQNYESPTSACVAYEVLNFIRSKTSKLSSSLTVIFPCLTVVRNSSQNLRSLCIEDLEQSLYAAEINEASDFSKAIVKGLKILPPTAQICDEFLACMLHFARVLLLPALLLLAPTTRISRSDSKGAHFQQAHETQMLCKLGDLLANHMGLTFSKDLLENIAIEIEMDAEDDWRRLYG
ncbi:hypothetical protein SUGI_0094230 [Cryptomeria japonica]|uniref:uncharacterized protein LOC131063788 n=1 Tax=Cryptomeria japonica TaxID=3369 RepID=UPI002408E024|nr:uncharacterized protein LOC131063788 [Cryptomeria japonica]GLJ08714.1 hypothetical protein SUGI_0094230 [Cryptomeria japonica]